MVVLLTFVIPRFVGIFDQVGQELPTITKVVIAMSNFLTGYWYILLILIVGIVVGIKGYKKYEEGALFFGRMAMKMPLFGKLVIKMIAQDLQEL